MNRTPAIIFDFGNVLASFDYARAGERLGTHLGLSGEDFLQRAREAGLPALLRDYESGRFDSDTFARSACDLVGLEIPIEEFSAAWADIFTLNPAVAELAAELKRRGYTLVLGSNTNEIHASHFRREFAEALAPFDALVLSHEVGHIKPSPEFYLTCARAANTEAKDCVFIDDLPENVEGARAAGLLGIIFFNVPALRDALLELGVEIGRS